MDNCCSNVSITLLGSVTNGPCPEVITRTWQATDCCGNSATSNQTTTVVTTMPPVIASQPLSQTVCDGSVVTFHVSLSGNQSLSYQWQKNGVNINGAISASYSIANIQPSDAANYSVVVSGDCGPVTSDPATLTVNVCGIIKGKLFAETDFNCLKNGPAEPVLVTWQVNANPGGHSTTTGSAGDYLFTLPAGNYTVSVTPQPGYTPTCPISSSHIVNLPSGITRIRDFAYLPSLGLDCPNLWVNLTAIYPGPKRFHVRGPSTPCCGSDFTYMIYYGNNGTLPVSGATMEFNYPASPLCSIVSINSTRAGVVPSPFIANSTPVCPPAFPSSGLQTFSLPTLNPGDYARTAVKLHLCCDITARCTNQFALLSRATILPLLPNDCRLADNVSTHAVTPCCSSDPNDCTVTPTGCGPQGLIHRDQVLTYLVQFQNEGPAPANLVVIHDILDPSLDLDTLEILGSSHDYIFERDGRELLWAFPNIDLASQYDDEPASHGFVKFRIRPIANAPVGTLITNNAQITFDINAPITTITTTNTITEDPLPIASFTVLPHAGSAGHTNDFHYTGGTVGAQCLWDFGPNAVPQISSELHPSGVVFTGAGPHLVALTTSLGDCVTEPAVQVVMAGRPALRIVTTDTELALSWSGDGFVIQETDDLTPPVQWQTIQAQPTAVSGWYRLNVSIVHQTSFYRLIEAP